MIVDHKVRGWSWHDFAYDVAGAAAGSLLYQQLK